MKSIIAIGAVALFVAVPALGVGTATFIPSDVYVPAGTPAIFDIEITSGVGNFDAADLLIGSDDLATPVPSITAGDFAYHPDWNAAFASVTTPVYATGMFGYDYFVQVGGGNSTPVGASVMLGTVTLDTTGVPNGDYYVRIDSNDGFSELALAGAGEDLSGYGIIHIPEPGSLALLGLGMVVGLRRRRA